MTADDRRLTVPEVAERLRVSERFILRELRAKNLRGLKKGNRWTVLESDLATYENAGANVALVRGRS